MNGEKVRLGDICELKYGKSLSKKVREAGEFCVYGSNGVVDNHVEGFTSGKTIIIGRKGSIGEVAFSDGSCWPIDTTYYVDETATKQDARWLYYTLGSLGLTKLNKSAAIPGLNRNDAYDKELWLPPLAEQKRIAGILDQAAELCRLRTRALEKLNTLGQAIFYEMFLGTSRKTVPLSGILREVQIGPFGSLLHKSDYVSGGTPLINPMHINSGQLHPDLEFTVSDEKLAKLHRYILMEGDIVMGRRGEMGRCAVVSGEHPQMICGTGSMVLRVNKKNASPDFLGFFLSTPEAKHRLENAASGVTMLNLNSKSLDDVPVPLTSIEEQETFADKLRSIRKQTSILNIAVSEANALFASLQHRAFRGEL